MPTAKRLSSTRLYPHGRQGPTRTPRRAPAVQIQRSASSSRASTPPPPEAIAGILRHLKIPDPPPDPKFKAEDVNILDPCAGEAKALVQLAEGLGVSKDHVFAVELNASRAARIAEAYPDVRLLGPCSFEATRITRHSFSLVYLNPPFDDEFGGGGREETSFLRQAVDLLVPGGILVLVCPVNQVFGAEPACASCSTPGSTSSSCTSSRMTAGRTTSASCSAVVARRR